ncbi:MAG: TetR/AcrR family transcriptional regulator [Chloroflexi bacterium]|nr:TetR/AcrR family transcriptional regulator [Chloroflexota bacterium]
MSTTRFPTPKQRRQRRRDEMIEAIVEASRTIMREHGVAALNLNEIARMLGIRAPSLYEYFPNKMALYDHLFRLGTRLARQSLAHVDDGPDVNVWEVAERAMTAYFQWSIDNPDLFKLVFERHVPGFVPSDDTMAEMIEFLKEGTERMQRVFRSLPASRRLSVEQMRDMFIAIQHGITALHLANSPDLPLGQGRYGGMVPLVIAMLQAAWSE